MRPTLAAGLALSLGLSLAPSLGCVADGVGGGDVRSVAVRSEPAGAAVRVTRIDPWDGYREAVPLPAGAATPLVLDLSFADRESYEVEATAPGYRSEVARVDYGTAGVGGGSGGSGDESRSVGVRRGGAGSIGARSAGPGASRSEPRPQPSRGDGAVPVIDLRLAAIEGPPPGVAFGPVYGGSGWELRPVGGSDAGAAVRAAAGAGASRGASAAVERTAVRLTDNADPAVDLRSVAASPTRDALLYQRVERAGPGGRADSAVVLWTPDAPPARLTRRAAPEFTPAFGPYGDEAIFATPLGPRGDGPATLVRRPIDSTVAGEAALAPVLYADVGGLAYDPSVGVERVAYAAVGPSPDARPRVWVAGVDGSGASPLAEGTSPRISPDDRRVLYLADDGGRAGGATGLAGAGGAPAFGQLRVVDARGGASSPASPDPGLRVADPAWSPDGRHVAFAAESPGDGGGGNGGRAAGNVDLYLMPADGSRPPVRLTDDPARDAGPAFDRTGRSLYFRSDRGGSWNVWRVDLDPAAVLDADRPPR